MNAATIRRLEQPTGLQRGDIVVTAGASLLQPGQKVRLLDAPVASPPAAARSNEARQP